MNEKESYTYETLSTMVGKNVSVSDSYKNKTSLKIKQVKKHNLNDSRWEGFTVIYQGEGNFRITQGTYLVKHPEFGEKDLFISPKSDIEYENIITRKNRNFLPETKA